MVCVDAHGETVNFNIGDRVRLTNIPNERAYGDHDLLAGVCGTVRSVQNNSIGVEYDIDFRGGHNLHGGISNPRGWFTTPGYLELILEDGMRRCFYCNAATDDCQVVDGRAICTSCMSTHTFICESCGQVHDTRRRMRGSQICRPCFNEKYTRCSFCDAVVLRDLMLTGGVGDVCPRCYEEHTVVCSICGHRSWKQDYDHDLTGGAELCLSCLEKNFPMCRCCSERLPADKTVEVFYSDGCLAGHYCLQHAATLPHCDHCHHIFLRHEVSSIHTPTGTENLCDRCAQELYPVCSECGTRIFDGYAARAGFNVYCRNCEGNARYGFCNCYDGSEYEWEAPEGINDYSYKPTPVMYPRKDKENPVYLGFELEVDGGADDDDANTVNSMLGYTYVKHDGSLHDGMEIVTHPAQLGYHVVEKRSDWIKALHYLRSHGLSSHTAETCGLHVHVSSAPLEFCGTDTIEKILYIWTRFWDELLRFSRRDTNSEGQMHWAEKPPVDYRLDAPTEEIKSELTYAKGDMEEGDRYCAVNLTNKHTIEFRLFRGTLRPETLFATLELVNVLTNVAMTRTFDEIRAMTWQELTSSDYPELNEYLASRAFVGSSQNWLDEDDDDRETLLPLPQPHEEQLMAA